MSMNHNEIKVEELGLIQVYDESGQSVELATLWSKTPAVLVFVRHFG